MRVKKWVINNVGLKAISLILAIATWFYVNQELVKIKSEKEKAIIDMLQYDVITKRLPIQLTLAGELKSEYEIKSDGIVIDPSYCIVIGPEIILQDVNIARTVPINLSEYTKDINREVLLAPIAEGISLKNFSVKVQIPILKKGE